MFKNQYNVVYVIFLGFFVQCLHKRNIQGASCKVDVQRKVNAINESVFTSLFLKAN